MQPGDRRRWKPRIEDSVAGAHHCAVFVKGIGQANPRGEVLRRLRNPSGLGIINVSLRRLSKLSEFITQSIIDRQSASSPPLILRVKVEITHEDLGEEGAERG